MTENLLTKDYFELISLTYSVVTRVLILKIYFYALTCILVSLLHINIQIGNY